MLENSFSRSGEGLKDSLIPLSLLFSNNLNHPFSQIICPYFRDALC